MQVEDLGMNDTHMVMINFGLTKNQKQINEQMDQMSRNVTLN